MSIFRCSQIYIVSVVGEDTNQGQNFSPWSASAVPTDHIINLFRSVGTADADQGAKKNLPLIAGRN